MATTFSVYLVLLMPMVWQVGYATSPENELFRDLKKNYSKSIRPLYDPNEIMDVSISFFLKKIENYDERNQVLHSFGWLAMTWHDELLTWNPADYGDAYRLVVDASEIWLPEIAMFNSVNQGNDLSLDVKFRAAVMYDGLVTFAPGFKWSTECKAALENFPYDQQTCTLQFVNWVYTSNYLRFRAASVVLENYVENDQWDLVNVTADQRLVNVTGDDRLPQLPEASLTITIKRKPMYYVVNVITPCFLIAVLSCLVFLMPSDAGEKVSLSITVLLSYTVILLMVSDVTPKSGFSLPYITIFIIMSMAETGLSLVITIVILTFYHHPGHKPVPSCLRCFVFNGLARIACMRDTPGIVQNSGKVSPTMVENKLSSVLGDSKAQLEDLDDTKHDKALARLLPDDVVVYLRYLMEKEKEKEVEEQNRAEWVAMGMVLDRFMFYFFIVLIAGSILGFTVTTKNVVS